MSGKSKSLTCKQCNKTLGRRQEYDKHISGKTCPFCKSQFCNGVYRKHVKECESSESKTETDSAESESEEEFNPPRIERRKPEQSEIARKTEEINENVGDFTDEEINNAVLIEDEPKSNINWARKFDISTNYDFKPMSHDEVDKRPKSFFQEGFSEFIVKPDFVRPYFDYDDLKSIEEFNECKKQLDEWSKVFGPYSYGGYSYDEEVADEIDVTFIEKLKLTGPKQHFISLHLVYYESKIKAIDLREFAKTKDGRYVNQKFAPKSDPNVYDKLSSRQALRHPLSPKPVAGTNNFIQCAGKIAGELLPSTCIATVKGDEKYVPFRELTKIWGEITINAPIIAKKPVKVMKSISPADLTEVEIDSAKVENESEELIEWSEEQLFDFLKDNFEPEFSVMQKDLAPLWHSSIDKDMLIDVLIRWYELRTHSNGSDCVSVYINKYYAFENSNKWFYSLIRRIPIEKRIIANQVDS
jgi:hypothetical protein